MTKSIQKWLKTVGLAIFTGIALVQVVYAVIWAVKNGNNIQDFYDTALYLERAATLTSDGWRLVGYSCFLRVFSALETILGDNYVIIIYLLQAVISLLCIAKGCQAIAKLASGTKVSFKMALIPAGYILTLPMVWQMQFALLPDALALSLIVLLFASLIELINANQTVRWDCILIAIGTLLLLGVWHRYYFFGAIVLTILHLIIITVRLLYKKYRTGKLLLTGICLLLMIVILPVTTGAVNRIVPKDGAYATYSLQAELLKRFVFPNLWEDYPHYSDKIKEIISQEDALVYQEFFEYYFSGLAVEIEGVNPEEARNIYVEMAETGISVHGTKVVKDFVKEIASYTLLPAGMLKCVYNNDDSLYGYNFIRMYETAPKLTADYMHIGVNGLLMISLVGVVLYAVNLFVNRDGIVKGLLYVFYAGISILCVTLPMMLFAFAKFDYRLGLFSAFVWGTSALMGIVLQGRKEIECHEGKME